MGIMSFLRERMGTILVVIIGIALFAFVAGEVITYGKTFFEGGNDNYIGEVAGEKISYDEFSNRVKQQTQQFQQQSGQTTLTPQITDYINGTAWNQSMSQIILKKEMDKLNIVVGSNEISSMVSGPTPDQQIAQYFTDPKTGQLNRAALNDQLRRVQTAKPGDPSLTPWVTLVSQVIDQKKVSKYIALVHNGLYVNSLEAKDNYLNKNKLVSFKYVALDYSSVPDNKVNLTDDDYNSYYNEHKYQFNNKEESRSFEYVSFNAAPSKSDTVAIKEQMDKILPGLRSSTNDSLFVQVNAETKAPLVYQKKGQLEPILDSVMFNASNGFTYGPYVSAGSYKVAKLVDARMSPDSVNARHILISAATAGGNDKALARADSLRKLIQAGRPFAELAKTFSEDKQSAEKGGDLGTFGRGAMVPVFEDAAFNGKPGDLKIVTSQFGVHLINVVSQKGSSKVVKVAVIDKPLSASQKTQSEVYNKAQSFLGTVNGDNFTAQAKKAGLAIKNATDVNGIASSLPGIDNARELVKWAFTKADKKGDISDEVYALGDQYVVARLTQIKPKGTLPLEDVKQQIKQDVINMVKAKQLHSKLEAAANGASTIEQVAQKAGAKVTPVDNVVFANPMIPGYSLEYKVVGSIFGSKVNKVSKPVDGQSGVYVYVVNGFTNPAPLTNTLREKQQMSEAMMQQIDSRMFDALKDKANVKDNRAKFL